MTQSESLVKRLSNGWTTALDALNDCGRMRLAARVLEMRRDGLKVSDKWVEINGKRFKAYRLVE